MSFQEGDFQRIPVGQHPDGVGNHILQRLDGHIQILLAGITGNIL